MDQQAVIARLQQYNIQRQAVRTMDTALQVLSPEERLIAEHLLIAPYRGAITHLAQLLDIEPCSIYRRKAKVIRKLSGILGV